MEGGDTLFSTLHSSHSRSWARSYAFWLLQSELSNHDGDPRLPVKEYGPLATRANRVVERSPDLWVRQMSSSRGTGSSLEPGDGKTPSYGRPNALLAIANRIDLDGGLSPGLVTYGVIFRRPRPANVASQARRERPPRLRVNHHRTGTLVRCDA
jgi:hypothetical protein